jgi:cobalt/nickel transport system permease protein
MISETTLLISTAALLPAAAYGAKGTKTKPNFSAADSGLKTAKNEKLLKIISLGLFVFAMQMLNFSIAPVNFSGHIVGAILLCMIIGRAPAFFTMSGILAVQCIFFGDGGLTALPCNIFNMAVLPCFLIMPIADKFVKNNSAKAFLASVVSLEIGALLVTVESFEVQYMSQMLLVHLPIGIVEGILTAALVYAFKTIGEKRLSYAGQNAVVTSAAAIVVAISIFFASGKTDGMEYVFGL